MRRGSWITLAVSHLSYLKKKTSISIFLVIRIEKSSFLPALAILCTEKLLVCLYQYKIHTLVYLEHLQYLQWVMI